MRTLDDPDHDPDEVSLHGSSQADEGTGEFADDPDDPDESVSKLSEKPERFELVWVGLRQSFGRIHPDHPDRHPFLGVIPVWFRGVEDDPDGASSSGSSSGSWIVPGRGLS